MIWNMEKVVLNTEVQIYKLYAVFPFVSWLWEAPVGKHNHLPITHLFFFLNFCANLICIWSQMVEEAGGTVSCMDGAKFNVFDRSVLVSNGVLHEKVSRRSSLLKSILYSTSINWVEIVCHILKCLILSTPIKAISLVLYNPETP